MIAVNYYCWFEDIIQGKMFASTQGVKLMSLTNTVKPESKESYEVAGSDLKKTKTRASCAVEKLLFNISNKLGLSLAIYQK